MQYRHSRAEKSDSRGKNLENTTESGYGEMIYMEPSNNQMMSPVTEGRQTLRQSPGENVSRSIVSTVKMNLRERPDTAQLVGEKPIQSLVVAIPSRGIGEERLERSPKTINIGDTKEQTEYNIRTLNARKSPKGGLYQNYNNIDNGNIGLDQPMQYSGFIQGNEGGYQMGNDSNVMMGNIQSKNSPGMIMNPREGREPMINKMSPNQNIDDINSSQDKGYESQAQWNNLKNVLGNQNRINATYDLPNEKIMKETQIKYNNATYNNMTMGDVKNLVKRFTKVYDPRKTQEGALISQSQVIVPGANDEVFNGRYRVLQKMNRLSNILLSKRRDFMSPDKENSLNNSLNETRKSFDRHTLNRNTLKNGRMSIKRSPEHKFLYVSLAMISSKGPNTEDRTILRKMRFDKGGVVDLAQEERKKGKYKIKKVQNRRGIRGASPVMKPNPKYREQAAKLIQAWWRELKELYKQRLDMIIKIQSFWRGRWVRKYMYDILYLSFMYQSFCQIIQKVLVKHIRPYVFGILTSGEKNKNTILRNLLLKDRRWQLLKIKPYLDLWIAFLRQSEVRNLRGRRLFDIRSEQEKRQEKLLKYFDKWTFLSKISNLKNNADTASREKNKYLGMIKMLENANKLGKRIALKNSKSKLLDYLKKKARNDKLNKLVKNKPDLKKQILKKYLDKWHSMIQSDKHIDFKKKLSTDLLDNACKRIKQNLLRNSFNKITRLPKKPEVIEKIVVQEKIYEKEAKTKGVNPDYLNASKKLENALLRLTYKYPLDAIDDKLVRDNRFDKLLKMINIKEKYGKNILKKYINKWLNKCKNRGNTDLIKKMILRLLNTVLKKIKNRILSNKFNQWRNKILLKGEDIDNAFKKSKGLDKISSLIKKKSSKIYGKDFLDNLNKRKSQRVYKNALLKIIDNYFNKERNKLRTFLNKWKDQIRKMQIFELKVKIIKYLGNKNDLNNRKLKLSKIINRWLMKSTIDKVNEKGSSETLKRGKNDKKKFAALIMKILKRVFKKNDKETVLRKALKKWLKKLKKLNKKENENITEGTKHIIKFNSLKNSNDLLDRLRNNFISTTKINRLKKLLPKRKEGERLKLLKNILRWRNRISSPKEKQVDLSNYKERYLKNIITKRELEKIIRALYKWKSNLKPKTSNAPLKYGLDLLKKTLKKNSFKTIKKTGPKKLKEIPKNLTLMEALLRGDLSSAKGLALKKIPLLHYFLKWRNNVRKEKVNETKYEMFKKLFLNPLKRFNKFPLRKYFNRWRDKNRKSNVNDLEKTIYMKLMKNFYEKHGKNILKKKLRDWKNKTDKLTKNINDTIKAIDNLRRTITSPIFQKTQIKEGKLPIDSKLKSVLISRFLSTKRNLLNKYLNRWKKALDKKKDDKIRNRILQILIKQQDLKDKNYNKNKLREMLLKWRIKCAPKTENPLDKITNIRKGLEILEKVLRKPNLNDIFIGIKNRKKRIGGGKLISKIIKKTAPKIRKNILKKYLDKWRSKIPDTNKEKEKVKNTFEDILKNKNMIKKQFEPYKDLATILKELYKNKTKKGQKLIDFFRKIKDKKKNKIIEERNRRLHILFMKNNNKELLRYGIAKWRRNARNMKANEDALIIINFCKTKIKKIFKKRINVDQLIKALRKVLLRRAFNKLFSGGKKRLISILLKKIIKNNEQSDKKLLKNAFLKWKNIIPQLQKMDSIIKIQSALRGMKTRKKKKELKDVSLKLKLLYLKRKDFGVSVLRYTLLRWLRIAEKEHYEDNSKIIQKFLKMGLTYINEMDARNTFKDLFKTYIKKKIREILRRVTPIKKLNYDQLILVLDKISKRHLKDYFNELKNYSKLKKLKNIYPKIIDALKKYFIPLYLRKWKIISIDQRNKYVKIIQDFLRNKKKNKVTKIKNRIDTSLKNLFLKNSESTKSKIRRYFWKWIRKTKEIELQENAQIIQKFCKVHEKKKLKSKANNKNKLANFLKDYLISQITKTLIEINEKYLNPIKKALEKVKGVDKRYATNNIISFANDTIRRQLLLYVINTRGKNNKNDLLRKYLNKWKNVSDEIHKRAKKIQKFVRKIKGKKNDKKIDRIKEILLKLFMKHSSNKNDLLLYALRKWQLKTHLINCQYNADIIKRFIGHNLNKRLNNKLNQFFIVLAKIMLAKKLKDLSKIKKLIDTILKIILKKLIKNGKKVGKTNKITSILRNRIIFNSTVLKNNLLKRYLEKWRNNIKDMKEKDTKYSKILQNFFKSLKNKSKKNRLSSRLDRLKQILISMTRESPLRVAFNKYRSKVKRLSCQENADIIQRYCKRVKERRDKAKDKQNTINITLAFEKLKKINPYKRYAFDKIKKAKQIDALKKIIDYIIKKRLEILKDVLNNIKKGKKKHNKFLLKLLDIKKNFRDNLLKKYLKKWLEQNDKLKRKRAAEIIQKNHKIYKNKKKKTGINDFLLRIMKNKEGKGEEKYKTTLMRWLKNAKLKHANDAAKKIQNYLNKKTNNNRARKNWRKLSILLFKKNNTNKSLDILNKLRNYFAISKIIHILKEKMRKNILKNLLKKLKLQKLLKLLHKLLIDFSDKNKNHILKRYLDKWKDKANKLKQLKEILEKMVEDIDKRRKIIAAKTLGDVFLIKKLLHDILRVRALEFLKRLKNKGEYKKRLRALGDSLVKTKNDLDEKNKKIFLKSLYKVYYTRSLEKLINNIKQKQKAIKKKYGKYFFNLLKKINAQKSEGNSQSKHQGSNDIKSTRLQFKAHVSSLKTKTDDKKPYLYIIPLFIEFLKNKIKDRKEYSFKKIVDKDKYNKFCRLIKKYVMKKELPNKREFLDKIMGNYKNLTTKGPLLEKLYKMLRLYIIKQWMKILKEPSKLYRIFYLFKMTFMHRGIAERRFIREIIRKWRFTTFVKVMAKRKLELMYKNLHVSYLQMANEVFGDEETTTNASVVKEFERFGTDVGMWGNEDPNIPTETGYVKSINKKYIFETLDGENSKLFDEFNSDFELKKKIIVSDIIKEDSKIVEGGKSSNSYMEGSEKESGSESSRRRRNREKKDESKDENINQDIKVESEGRGRRSYRRKKEEKKDEDDEKKLSHRNMRKSHV